MMADESAGIPVANERLIRLQCLQLAHRPDKDEQTNIERAEKFFAYVMSGAKPPTPRGASGRQGKGNPPA